MNLGNNHDNLIARIGDAKKCLFVEPLAVEPLKKLVLLYITKHTEHFRINKKT